MAYFCRELSTEQTPVLGWNLFNIDRELSASLVGGAFFIARCRTMALVTLRDFLLSNR